MRSPTLLANNAGAMLRSQSKGAHVSIAVDDSGEVTLINHAAQALLDYPKAG